VNVQALLLEGGEAVGDRQELLVLLHEGVFEIGAEDVMPVLNLLQRRVELPLQFLGEADPEDLADLVGGQPPQPHLAGTFDDVVDGEVALEDKIAAVFDLVNSIESAQIHRVPLPLGELHVHGNAGAP